MILPEKFISRMKLLLTDEYEEFENALHQASPVSIRVNNKTNLNSLNEGVPWSEDGYYLPQRPLFTADPLFHAGAYYVQEASSMFLKQFLDNFVERSSTVLDLSAAPGGKSTLIAQHLDESGFLVSNEIVRSRANILRENIIKWGNSNCLVTNNSPVDFKKLPSFFDVLVVDAPCSGEGMFRKDEGAIDEWSLQNVNLCVSRQRNILAESWDTLKTGGTLIYSTCTFNREENEENVVWVKENLGAEILSFDVSAFPEVVVSEHGYRFYPHKIKGEGFFISALRKTAHSPTKKKDRNKNGASMITKDSFGLLNQLKNPKNKLVLKIGDTLSAVSSIHQDKVENLISALNVIHFGVTLATVKGRDLIPHISLALSKELDTNQVITVELSKEDAIRYLKKESLSFPEFGKGYLLVTYKSVPLGWVKNLESRSNNLYPNEWRIRMNL